MMASPRAVPPGNPPPRFPLSHREEGLVEAMDLPDCNLASLRQTYRRFGLVNRWIAGWEGIYRRFVRPLLSPLRTTRVVDVGCGGGDVAGALVRWAARDGLAVEVTAVDPDPRALAFAREHVPAPVRLLEMDSAGLLARGEGFDLALSNHVLHHLPDEAVSPFLFQLAELGERRAICSDIERSTLGYLLFSVGALPFARSSFIRDDGLLSIRRSFRREELGRLAPPGWRVMRRVPFRLLALHDAGR